MICSSIKTDADKRLEPKFAKVIRYLRETDFCKVPDGIYELDGRDIYAKVFTNTSKARSELRAEFHKHYADVQFWISGCEKLGFSYELAEDVHILPNEEEDVYFLDNVVNEHELAVKTGDYVILFPEDLHTPGIMIEKPLTYRKVVVKVRLD